MRKEVTPRAMLLDKRVVERNIKKGLITREEYEKSLAELPDVADQAEEIRARLGEEGPSEAKPSEAAKGEGEEETSSSTG